VGERWGAPAVMGYPDIILVIQDMVGRGCRMVLRPLGPTGMKLSPVQVQKPSGTPIS
jgi:hypothetical protein